MRVNVIMSKCQNVIIVYKKSLQAFLQALSADEENIRM